MKFVYSKKVWQESSMLEVKNDEKIKKIAIEGTNNILSSISKKCKIIFPSTHVIYEGLKETKQDINENEKNIQSLEKDKVFDIFQRNLNEVLKLFYRLEQEWVNRAYKKFNDFDSYLILMYLMNKIYINYSDRFHYKSLGAFYGQDKVGIEKINLIEISN